MKKLVIAIDGPVGSGKSTVARRAAQLLGYVYVDTGAMYRALALKALRRDVPFDATEQLVALAKETQIDLRAENGQQRVLLDGADITEAIRERDVSEAASKVAVIAGVRKVLVAEQRRAGERGGVVMEGRDIGSVVFPDAGLKIYLTASAEVRAQRRWHEHQQKGDAISLELTLEEVHERDRRDRERTISPLVRAPDAVLVDSSAMDAEEVARLIVLLAEAQSSERAHASNHS
jgi:cytidylate kinase